MIFEALDRVGAKADRLMLYPQGWIVPTDNGSTSPYQSKLLARARDAYGVTLQPITVQTFVRGEPTWEDSFTKLLAFNQTAYKRVVVLDSDATVRKAMDELFFLPAAPIAMPRAYWMEQLFLSSQMLVVTPSREEWGRVEAVMREKEDSGFDMDILNALYNDSCTVIPHRGYTLLSGEFRGDDHKAYLGSDEAWDPMRALEEARFVHFSDWPRPKPWLRASEEIVEDMVPKCTDSTQGPDCMSRDIWLDLYEDFADRRERICGQRYDEG
ncbi:glucose N-acetyltransferase [Polyplosphaeria fusca]|uniref:Glucose N-acetyltransferase n=1 Tax=Polyplosphaeria fusca TaxID=682080 RepID=A0A9P4QUA7_9PLEO|nr:glucose N-acetyltransferase [Polyplosphaeria fusca]